MTTVSIGNQNANTSIGLTMRRMWETSRFFSITLILFILMIPISATVAALNPATIDGARIWFKPLKFAIATAFYLTTLLWMLSHITRWRWVVRLVAIAVSANLLFDMSWVVVQAMRGVRSHFNFSTTIDGAVYSAVGTSINMVMLLNLVAMVLVLTQRLEDKQLQWALVLGMAAATVGGFSAIPMTIPSATQMATMESGEDITVIGAHSVGVEDGGPGLPFVGWSTVGGDGRVPHFVGLHGLQIVPLLGLFLNNRWRNRLSGKSRSGVIWLIGLGYIGLTLLLLWQAQRGQSVIAPDMLTIAAFGALLAAIVGGVGLILKNGFRPNLHPQTQL